MHSKVVAVTMRLAPAVGYHEERDAISHDWVRLLSSKGLLPILIPNLTADPAAILAETGASRILLTNGDSIGPLPGEPNGPSPTERDRLEFNLMDYAVANRLPVMGVCRGLQLINIYFGGQITRNLADVSGEQHVACEHNIQLKSGDELHNVNSFHGQGVMSDQVAPELSVTGVSPAGVVEAMEHTKLPIWAVQWHPERSGAPSAMDELILKKWMSK
jgi:gamma-glutamyl-gamma-aminobutyrate hydrolase PuuD